MNAPQPAATAPVENNVRKRIAVLVDGDNVAGTHAPEIQRIAQAQGTPQVIRVYLDAQRPTAWHDVPGFRLIHAGQGKNASDLLMAIDAMELALSDRADSFVIVSSDGDFTHLAQRLREFGFAVMGLGDHKAPRHLRAACTAFTQLTRSETKALVSEPTQAATVLTEIDRKISREIATQGQKGKGLRLALLGARMHRMHNFRISTQPERTWRAYLLARPHLFDLGPRGPDAMVRLRPGNEGA
jgi:hypothetical protein